MAGSRGVRSLPDNGIDAAMAPEEMDDVTLEAIRARLEEPPPLLALAERHRGNTALSEYLARLQADRIALVDEVGRLRAELGREADRHGGVHCEPNQGVE